MQRDGVMARGPVEPESIKPEFIRNLCKFGKIQDLSTNFALLRSRLFKSLENENSF